MSAPAQLLPEAPYPDAESALRRAFSLEACRGYPKVGGIHGTNPSDLSLLDLITEASMVRSRALRPLGVRERLVFRCWWGVERESRRWSVRQVGSWLASELRHSRRLMIDVVRHWSPMDRGRRSWSEWATELGKSPRTVHRWCVSKNPDDRSAMYLLDEWLVRASGKAETALRDGGVIP